MVIVDPMRPRFHNLASGYEIRRKDWAKVTFRFPSFSPEYWDARTVYIETIPHQYRPIVGICNLLCPILNSSATQKILFPPHHQDPPDAVPKCKGFALVALTAPTIASRLLSLFSYDSGNAHHPTGSSLEESGARKAGFCALSKDR